MYWDAEKKEPKVFFQDRLHPSAAADYAYTHYTFGDAFIVAPVTRPGNKGVQKSGAVWQCEGGVFTLFFTEWYLCSYVSGLVLD